MRSSTLSLLALASLFIFSACVDETIDAWDYTIKQVFPVKVGSKWELKQTDYDITRDEIISIDTTEIRIESDTTYYGKPAYYAFTFDDHRALFYSNDDLQIGIFGFNVSASFSFLRYPMADGEIYVISDTTYPDHFRERTTLRILSRNEKVTVPAGTFDCVKYERLIIGGLVDAFDTTSTSHIYLAPFTGYIKENVLSHSGKLIRTYELIKYTK